MVTPRVYAKVCDAGRLTQELITAGILQSPTPGFKMFGVEVAAPNTTVYVIDSLSGPDGTTIDNVVTAHVNTPLIEQAHTGNIVVGGRLSWLSNTEVTIGTVGKVSYVRDSTDIYTIGGTGLLTANILSSGANGLDTGAAAINTWYAVFVIGDTRGINNPASLLSVSATAPTLPSGYDVFRRVGWVRAGPSNAFLKFHQIGNGYVRKIFYDDTLANLQVLSSGNATAFTPVSLAAVVPPTAQEVCLRVGYKNTGGGATQALMLRVTGSTQAAPPYVIQPGVVVSDIFRVTLDMVCNANQSIDYKVGAASNQAHLAVNAYIDEL